MLTFFAFIAIANANAFTQTLVWSANFETGSNSQFNGAFISTCLNGIIGVSKSREHAGNYSGYYYGEGNVSSTVKSCREYREVNFNVKPYLSYLPITNFRFLMWVYVPNVTLNGWFSLATFGDGDDAPFTIDVTNRGQIQLFVSIAGNNIITQNLVPSALSVPFDRWFSLSILALNLGTSYAEITIYQNGTPIIYYQGNLLSGGLSHAHFGLYMSNKQPSVTL